MSFGIFVDVFAVLYAFELLFLSYAAYLARRTPRERKDSVAFPKVSVVVAAKDEEKALPACIDSITRIDYPCEMLEVLIVDDQSSDSTPKIIDQHAARFPFVKRIDAVKSLQLRGKANALAQGIERATGEFIFLTDADCTVPPSWIKDTLNYFDEDTGIVPGVTLISTAAKPIHGLQALDWDFLLTVGAGLATIGKPVACLGNNLVFRKAAYDDVGGYREIKFSVTEDYALFKSIVESRKWKFVYPMDSRTLVKTIPLEHLKDVFAQRKRWATGGKDTGVFGKLILAPGFVLHWLMLAAIFFQPLTFIVMFPLKFIIEAAFLIPTLRRYGKIAHLNFILYFEIYYLIYVAILPFSVYFGKSVIWKGRKY